MNKPSAAVEELLKKIKLLEIELIEELQKQQQEFTYEIHKRQIYFTENIILKHKQYAQKLVSYLFGAPLKHILSVPFIWLCLIPAVFMDIVVSLYQAVCFPIYGIPKVKRQDYLIFDRQYLQYLNLIEKFNCAYCSYFNGLVAYIQEIAARTEQFWCPIKHAQRLKKLHSRYQHFLEYGDAEGYRIYLEKVRHSFKDLE
jgi:hypothetical protein